MLELTIAWRNIWRHQGKSLVIGAILFLGAFLLTLGNAVIAGMEKGLDRNVVGGFTGDVVLVAEEQEEDNVLLSMMGEAVENIYRFDTLRPRLEKSGLFRQLLPVGKNFAMAINEQGGTAGYAFLLGVNFQEWREMFPNSLEILHGTYPAGQGLLLSTGGLQQLYSTMGIWFWPKGYALDTATLSEDAREAYPRVTVQNDVVFMGFGKDHTASDIRLGLDGVSRFQALNRIWGHFLFVDIGSYRRCMGLFALDAEEEAPNPEDLALLQSREEDLEALFGEEAKISTPPKKRSTPQASEVGTPRPPALEEAGAYNLVLARFTPDLERPKAIDSLRRYLRAQSLPLRALSWQEASGPIGSMTSIIKLALNVFVFLLFLVAIIIIVNTLSMAALERTSEIGMMRAVGAPRRFISLMFLGETTILALIFGGLGIGCGIVAVFVVQAQRWSTDNDILQLFYGGDTFYPLFGVQDLALTLGQLALVVLLATLYPMRVAQSITPLDAIARD